MITRTGFATLLATMDRHRDCAGHDEALSMDLSTLLRYKAHRRGMKMDTDGFADIVDVARQLNRSVEDILNVAETSFKRREPRFEVQRFPGDGPCGTMMTIIRANWKRQIQGPPPSAMNTPFRGPATPSQGQPAGSGRDSFSTAWSGLQRPHEAQRQESVNDGCVPPPPPGSPPPASVFAAMNSPEFSLPPAAFGTGPPPAPPLNERQSTGSTVTGTTETTVPDEVEENGRAAPSNHELVAELRTSLQEKCDRIEKLQDDKDDLTSEGASQLGRINEKDHRIAELETVIGQKDQRIAELEKELSALTQAREAAPLGPPPRGQMKAPPSSRPPMKAPPSRELTMTAPPKAPEAPPPKAPPAHLAKMLNQGAPSRGGLTVKAAPMSPPAVVQDAEEPAPSSQSNSSPAIQNSGQIYAEARAAAVATYGDMFTVLQKFDNAGYPDDYLKVHEGDTVQEMAHAQADDKWVFVKLSVGREGSVLSHATPGWMPRGFLKPAVKA